MNYANSDYGSERIMDQIMDQNETQKDHVQCSNFVAYIGCMQTFKTNKTV